MIKPTPKPPVVVLPSSPTIRALFDINAWLAQAQPGQTRVYHTGDLATDREIDVLLDTEALLWGIAAKSTLVQLFQRRISEGRYEYLARRTRTAFTGRVTVPPKGQSDFPRVGSAGNVFKRKAASP